MASIASSSSPAAFMASSSNTTPFASQSQDHVVSRISFSSSLIPLSLKLDWNNYAYWRSQVLPAIRERGLEGFLQGNIPCHIQFTNFTTVSASGQSETVQVINPEFIL